MSPPGRNAPCPCGSGRKYKHCCLGATPVTPLMSPARGAFTEADRTRSLGKLLRFSQRPRFAKAARVAASAFGLGRLDFGPPRDPRLAEVADQTMVAFQTWFVFDFEMPGEGGGTIARQFLGWPGAGLTTAERTWLERMSGSAIRLYEVQEVELDRGFTLGDIGTGETIRVRERLGTHQIVPWDLLGVRVILGPEGEPVMEGFPGVYPQSAREAIRRDLERHAKEIRRRLPRSDETAVSKLLGPRFFHLWLEHVALRPDPVVVTAAGGDPIVFTRAVFDVRDPAGVASRLATHPELEPEVEGGGAFVWIELDGVNARALGRIVLEGNRLTLETMSEPRAERGRVLLEEFLGDAIRYRMTRMETLEQAMARESRRKEPEVTPEEREVMAGFLKEHYRTWPDHPLPALAGRTPRHAARLTTQRAKVVSLLKDLESHMERDRQAGRPAIDLGWLWDDLGIERPGGGSGEE